MTNPNLPLASQEAERPAGTWGTVAPSSLGIGRGALGAFASAGGGVPAGAVSCHQARFRRGSADCSRPGTKAERI